MKAKNRIRNHNFSMRLREYEDALLDAKKDEAGMTKSEYLRNIILFAAAGERPKFPSALAEEIYQSLNGIGNSINETAHAVNSRRNVLPSDIKLLMNGYVHLLEVYDEFVRDKAKSPY